jgi:uncharacterized protein
VGGVRDWNVVCTTTDGGYDRACALLRRLGCVGRTRFYNVLVMRVPDPRALMDRLDEFAVEHPELLEVVAREAAGVRLQAARSDGRVRAAVTVAPGARVAHPVHLCFGMLPAEGSQVIDLEVDVGEGAAVRFLAHCSFPNAVRLEHEMHARVRVGADASMTYDEGHFHGPHGGIVVRPEARIGIGRGGRFTSTFRLLHGRVGRLAIDYDVVAAAESIAELVVKAYGSGEDHVRVHEVLHLDGQGARGLARTRIAVRDHATSEVLTVAEGNAPFARGHMDCAEIVRDHAVAMNRPEVVVRDQRARVTHEAAIGTVDRKELETLMARGLDEDAAVDVIVRGLLR